jgi:hypothetical protein
MIDSFQLCFNEGSYLSLNLESDNSVDLLKDNDTMAIAMYLTAKSTGITWRHGGDRITMLEKGGQLFGLPTPAMDRVVVIYAAGHPVFEGSRNAAIYNADGSLVMQLDEPILTSHYWKNYGRRLNDPSLSYDRIIWHNLKDHGMVINIRVGFNRNWYEDRVLNVTTGKLEDVIGCGRFKIRT